MAWTPTRSRPTRLIGHAAWSLAQQPVRAARALRRTVGVALKVREQNRQRPLTPPPAPFSAPATSINGPLSVERSFAASSLSLADVKAVKNAFGCTVNDVVLSCAPARRQLNDLGEELDARSSPYPDLGATPEGHARQPGCRMLRR